MQNSNTQDHVNSIGLLVADHVQAMLAYWDKDQVCRFANEAYMEWFGRSREEMVNKINMKELLGPLYEKNLPYISGALQGRAQTFEREIPTPSGELRYSLANYFPHIVDGQVKGFFVHVANITGLKLMEKKLKQSKEIIREQNERLMSLANIISHGLANFEREFSALSRLLMQDNNFQRHAEVVHNFKMTSDQFSETIGHLNDMVFSHSLGNYDPEHINLQVAVDKQVALLGEIIHSTGATIHKIVEQDIFILGNTAYVGTVLENLLTNAIRFRYPRRKPVIEIKGEKKEGRIRLVVEDNGTGIDLVKHGKDMFGAYQTFQKDGDTLGIGLYISKLQIEAMNGTIAVESEIGNGTRFIIELPSA